VAKLGEINPCSVRQLDQGSCHQVATPLRNPTSGVLVFWSWFWLYIPREKTTEMVSASGLHSVPRLALKTIFVSS
jgi:hypothetical protein